MGQLASGLAQGLAQGQQLGLLKEKQEQDAKLLKLRSQAAEIKLKQSQRQEEARESLRTNEQQNMDASATGAPGGGFEGLIPTPLQNAGQAPQPQKSFSELQAELSLGQQLDLGIDPAKLQSSIQQGKINDVILSKISGGISNGVRQAGGSLGSGNLSNMTESFSIGPNGATLKLNPAKVKFENGLAVDEQGNRIPSKDLTPFIIPMDTKGVQNFQNESGQNPPPGTTPQQAIEGGFQQLTKGQQRSISIEESGRISGLAQASIIGQEVKNELFDKEGNFVFGGEGGLVERSLNLANLKFGLTGDGRRIQLRMRDGIDGVLRARTGATANETEMKDLMDQFLPDPRDDDKTIKDKLVRFNDFVNGALNAVTLPPSLKSKIETSTQFAEQGGTRGFKIINRQ